MTLVRAVRADDLDGVAAIAAHYVLNSTATFAETPQTVAEWRERLGDLEGRGLPFLVAEADGEVAGYAYAGPWRPKPAYRYTVEDTIYLDPRHLGKGLGTALVGELVVSAEMARDSAAEFGHDPWAKLALYVVHGLLHLRGYDDLDEEAYRKAMAKRDDRHWVYKREGLPCRVCGTHILMEELGGRKLYWCPKDQA